MIKTFTISDIVSSNNYKLFNEITLNSMITLEKFLNEDLYTTYKGKLDNVDVIMKLYGEYSDANNEIEVLNYLQKHAPTKFPIPYASILYPKLNIDTYIEKLIIYQYIEGEELNKSSIINKVILKNDIMKQIEVLHKLNLVFGDIRIENIIKLNSNHYYLIDYGRVFSLIDKKFPPMNYMIEEDIIPSQEDDINNLNKIINF